MSDSSAQETVSRVLKSNAGEFEKKDVAAAALVGFLLGLLSLVFGVLMIWRSEESVWYQYVGLANAVLLMALSGFVLRRSVRATVMMLCLLLAGVIAMLVQSVFGEQIQIIGIAGSIIWGLIVWFKIFPAIDSIRVLNSGNDIVSEAPVWSMLEMAVVCMSGVMLLVKIWFEILGLFL